MPPELLRYMGVARPDAEGMVGHNRGGFRSPEFQCGAMRSMIVAVIRGDARGIDEGWRVIDATFQYQTERGHFGVEGSPRGGPSAVAFWLAGLDQAVLVLRESKMAPQYQCRIDQLRPRIEKAAHWLAEPRYRKRLEREDAEAPNRLLFDALAYGLSGVLCGDDELRRIGRGFVDAAMAKYRATDGVFLEKGGHDSSYQAVAALNLQVWTTYFPDEKLDSAARRAVCWERSRVGPDGRVDVTGNTRTGLGQERWMGREKGVDLSEVTLCLLYDYARTGDTDSLAAARRIIKRRTAR